MPIESLKPKFIRGESAVYIWKGQPVTTQITSRQIDFYGNTIYYVNRSIGEFPFHESDLYSPSDQQGIQKEIERRKKRMA